MGERSNQIYQGDRWFFDSGEYRSDAGGWDPFTGQWVSNIRQETMEDGTKRYGDKFTIEFGPIKFRLLQIPIMLGMQTEWMSTPIMMETDWVTIRWRRIFRLSRWTSDEWLSTLEGTAWDSSTLKFVVNEPGMKMSSDLLPQYGIIITR